MIVDASNQPNLVADLSALKLPFSFERLCAVIHRASKEARRAYHSRNYSAARKSDGSYVTSVDIAVHNYLFKELPGIDDAMVVSEEGSDDPIARISRKKIWIIDPIVNTAGIIDGTLNNSSINVSLVIEGQPSIGIIYYFQSNQSYLSIQGVGAFKVIGISPKTISLEHAKDPYKFVCYRPAIKQMSDETGILHKKLDVNEAQIVPINRLPKRLKAVMDGEADVYIEPRRISEWDLVAAIGFVQALGGRCLDLTTCKDVKFNNESLRLPGFILARPGVEIEQLLEQLKK